MRDKIKALRPESKVKANQDSPRKKKQYRSRLNGVDRLGFPTQASPKKNETRYFTSAMSHSPMVSPFTRSMDVGKNSLLFHSKDPVKQSHPTESDVSTVKRSKPKIRFIDLKARKKQDASSQKTIVPHSPIHSKKWISPLVSLHSTLKSFDDDLGPHAHLSTNQASVLRLFMNDWFKTFELEKDNYNSIVLHGEIALNEIRRLTENLYNPNEFMVGFCCMLLELLTGYFGNYSDLVKVLVTEVQHSIYKNCSGTDPKRYLERTPYFARVKIEQKEILNQKRLSEDAISKNDFAKKELKQMYEHLEVTLDMWDFEVTRSAFKAWYDTSVIRKRVMQRKLHWFSVWFSQSPQAKLKKILEEWHKVAHVNKQKWTLGQVVEHTEKVGILQSKLREMREMRDSLKEECLEIKKENQNLLQQYAKISLEAECAQRYVSTSSSRESSASVEGQLRAELVSQLVPPILVAQRRSQCSLGFLQRPDVKRISQYLRDIQDDKDIDDDLANVWTEFRAEPSSSGYLANLSSFDIYEKSQRFLSHLKNIHHNLIFDPVALDDPIQPKKKNLSLRSTIPSIEKALQTMLSQTNQYASNPALFFAQHNDAQLLCPHLTTFKQHSAASKGLLGLINGDYRYCDSVVKATDLAQGVLIKQNELDCSPQNSDPSSSGSWIVKYLEVARIFREYLNLHFAVCDLTPYAPNVDLHHAMTNYASDDKGRGDSAACFILVEAFRIWGDITHGLMKANILQVSEKEVEGSIPSLNILDETISPVLQDLQLPKGLQNVELERQSILGNDDAYRKLKTFNFENSKITSFDVEKLSELEKLVSSFQETLSDNSTSSENLNAVLDDADRISLLGWKCAAAFSELNDSSDSGQDLLDIRLSPHECLPVQRVNDLLFDLEPEKAELEVNRVIQILTEYEKAIRQAYPSFNPQIHDKTCIMTLEQFWALIKFIRLPSETSVLPSLKSGEENPEQKILASDFAEVLLRIAAEQFPESKNLSDQLTRLLVEHVRIHSSSDLSEFKSEMRKSDVQAVLTENKNLLRSIFKSYSSEPVNSSGKRRKSTLSIIFIEEYQWVNFTRDYKLLDERFGLSHATLVFMHAQDCTHSEEDMQMIYSEFCEAVISVALYKIADPFIPMSVKLNQFIGRYLRIKPF